MGRRQRNLNFMPGYMVFPGGQLDADELTNRNSSSLHGHYQAALRECQEETGYQRLRIETVPQPLLLARAITPANSRRRFDTLFFLENGNLFEKTGVPCGELEKTSRYQVDKVLQEESLADITFEVLTLAKENWLNSADKSPALSYPLYQYDGRGLHREILPISSFDDDA